MRAAVTRAVLFAAAFAIFCRAALAAPAISPDEQRVLDALDAGRALADMQLIAGSANGVAQGVGGGSVVAGNAEEIALAETIARRFRELGLATRIETFPVRAYRYSVPRLLIEGEPLAAVSLHAAGAVSGRRDGVPFAHGNEAGGTRLRATLVDVGDGYEADYARAGNVRGKAVLVRRELHHWPPLQVTEAAQHGAAAAAGMFSMAYPEIYVNEADAYVQVLIRRGFFYEAAVSDTVTMSSGTATADEDFDDEPLTVSWADGDYFTKVVNILITDDSSHEPQQQFSLQLSDATGGAIIGPRATATVFVADDDDATSPPPPPPPPSSGGGGGPVGFVSLLLL